MARNNTNAKSPVWYEGGLSQYTHPGMQMGSVFYVNFGGSDAADGLTPARPLLTLTAAIAACTDDRHDLIVVLNWWQNEACPIVLNKRHVTIVGAKSGSDCSYGSSLIEATGDTDVFTFAERDIAIHNLIINAGATSAGCNFSAGAGFVRQGIYNCYFRSSQEGILAPGVNAPAEQLTVQGCFFEGSVTGNGILYNSNGPFAVFKDNIFDSIPGIAFHANGAAGACKVLNNTFAVDSDVAGRAITLANSTTRWLVDGNRANFGNTAMAQNPFEDTSAAGVQNNWVLNYRNITATMPA